MAVRRPCLPDSLMQTRFEPYPLLPPVTIEASV